MNYDIPIGTTGTRTIQVTEDKTALHLGSGGIKTYATPAMVALMEGASVKAIDSLLPEGFASVGIAISVKHLAATPLGQTVKATATVTEVDRRKVKFAIEAWDELEKIGEGTHTRFIIDVAKFEERLEEKSKQANE